MAALSRSAFGSIGFIFFIFFLNMLSRLGLAPLLPAMGPEMGLSHAAAASLVLFVSVGYGFCVRVNRLSSISRRPAWLSSN